MRLVRGRLFETGARQVPQSKGQPAARASREFLPPRLSIDTSRPYVVMPRHACHNANRRCGLPEFFAESPRAVGQLCPALSYCFVRRALSSFSQRALQWGSLPTRRPNECVMFRPPDEVHGHVNGRSDLSGVHRVRVGRPANCMWLSMRRTCNVNARDPFLA